MTVAMVELLVIAGCQIRRRRLRGPWSRPYGVGTAVMVQPVVHGVAQDMVMAMAVAAIKLLWGVGWS